MLPAWCPDPSSGAGNRTGVAGVFAYQPGCSSLPFKLHQDRRRHIPRQRHRVTNWPAYDASLRQRGSLTVWFTEEAIAAWAAEPRSTRGGQPWYSPLAILTALTRRTVFRLALRQTEGLIGSMIDRPGLSWRVPDHTTPRRRAARLSMPRPQSNGPGGGAQPVHLLMDSTGLKLCGAGEWLREKHGSKMRRSWRKLHLGVDAETGQIVASALTSKDADDGAQTGALLYRITDPVASGTGDGAYDPAAPGLPRPVPWPGLIRAPCSVGKPATPSRAATAAPMPTAPRLRTRSPQPSGPASSK
jgi:Transposase DDE domain